MFGAIFVLHSIMQTYYFYLGKDLRSLIWIHYLMLLYYYTRVTRVIGEGKEDRQHPKLKAKKYPPGSVSS